MKYYLPFHFPLANLPAMISLCSNEPRPPGARQFEQRLIQLLRWRFEKSELKVDDHQKVGELPLEIDVVVDCPGPDWIPDFSKFPELFGYFRQHNIIFDLYEGEVLTHMINVGVESLRSILSVVPDEKLAGALGPERIQRIVAAVSSENLAAASCRKDMSQIVRLLVASLGAEQVHEMITREEESNGSRGTT